MEGILLDLVFEAEIVGDHGDEFGVCGLAAALLNGIAEVGVEGVHVAAVPRDLDGMANGALHAGGGGLVLLCDRGVEDLGDRVDDLAVLDRHQNGGAEILIALDVGRHADLMNDLGDLRFNIGCLHILGRGEEASAAVLGDGVDMLTKATEIVGLDKAKLGARRGGFHKGILIGKYREHDKGGRLVGRVVDLLAVAKHADAVQLGEAEVKEDDVGVGVVDLNKHVLAVECLIYVAVARISQPLPQRRPRRKIFIGYEYLGGVFHTVFSFLTSLFSYSDILPYFTINCNSFPTIIFHKFPVIKL